MAASETGTGSSETGVGWKNTILNLITLHLLGFFNPTHLLLILQYLKKEKPFVSLDWREITRLRLTTSSCIYIDGADIRVKIGVAGGSKVILNKNGDVDRLKKEGNLRHEHDVDSRPLSICMGGRVHRHFHAIGVTHSSELSIC
ncbi:conserved hypothetical protein [Ricinus communis]|uniref:Uncharacterized protein n=1 Tax=Ricinus communis TaxID=3988 RepID=B9RBJ3_RICCO|nr:conserved hypothetical protein [Ricinus communis]